MWSDIWPAGFSELVIGPRQHYSDAKKLFSGADSETGSEEDVLLDDDNDHDIDMDSMGGDSRRSLSPSKLTARQRAKGNKDLQEVLLALPNGKSSLPKLSLCTSHLPHSVSSSSVDDDLMLTSC